MSRKLPITVAVIVSVFAFLIFLFTTYANSAFKNDEFRQTLIDDAINPTDPNVEPMTEEEAYKLLDIASEFIQTVYISSVILMIIDYVLISVAFFLKPGQERGFGILFMICGFSHIFMLRIVSTGLLFYAGYKMWKAGQDPKVQRLKQLDGV